MSAIDLSQLPPPTLVDVDYEGDLLARFARLKSKLAEIGVTWDADVLEPDTIVKLQEADAYWRKLDMQSIDDMAVARTLGFARGADLDWIAATFYADLGLARMEGELDDRFERRILLAGEALAGALSAGGLVYNALTASSDIIDATAIQVHRGIVEVFLLVKPGADEIAAKNAVRNRLLDPKMVGSEEVRISLTKRNQVQIAVVLRMPASPAQEPTRLEAVARLEALKAKVETQIGIDLTTDELIAVARVDGVSKLLLSEPIADIVLGPGSVIEVTGIDVKMETIP